MALISRRPHTHALTTTPLITYRHLSWVEIEESTGVSSPEWPTDDQSNCPDWRRSSVPHYKGSGEGGTQLSHVDYVFSGGSIGVGELLRNCESNTYYIDNNNYGKRWNLMLFEEPQN